MWSTRTSWRLAEPDRHVAPSSRIHFADLFDLPEASAIALESMMIEAEEPDLLQLMELGVSETLAE